MQLTLFDPIEIPLTKGYVTIVDPVDADLAQFNWKYSNRYAARNVYGPQKGYIAMHRLIMERVLSGPIPKDMFVDHIDCNPLNNTRANLRLCSPSQNSCNRRPLAKHKGVSWHKQRGKWQAQIWKDGKCHYLGLFDTVENAVNARRAAAIKYHGEFARETL